jgi:hypothetical protein
VLWALLVRGFWCGLSVCNPVCICVRDFVSEQQMSHWVTKGRTAQAAVLFPGLELPCVVAFCCDGECGLRGLSCKRCLACAGYCK